MYSWACKHINLVRAILSTRIEITLSIVQYGIYPLVVWVAIEFCHWKSKSKLVCIYQDSEYSKF
ncbi:hypothetical protein BDW02DRAFT_563989, partial [Decorospora gaudefroyi]